MFHLHTLSINQENKTVRPEQHEVTLCVPDTVLYYTNNSVKGRGVIPVMCKQKR